MTFVDSINTLFLYRLLGQWSKEWGERVGAVLRLCHPPFTVIFFPSLRTLGAAGRQGGLIPPNAPRAQARANRRGEDGICRT